MRTKTWFITGCSSGLGRALCEEVLGDAQHLVATARNPDRRLLLGTDAWEMAQERLGHLRDEFAAHRDVTLSTDFADEDR